MKSIIFKIKYLLLTTPLIVFLIMSACSNSNINDEEVEQLLAEISTYQFNQSLKPMVRLDEIIRSIKIEGDFSKIETLMIDQLKNKCSDDGKDQICRRLRIIGTEKSATVLIEMLNNSSDFEKSLFALEKINGSDVDEMLYQEFLNRAGTEKIRLTNVMGIRSVEKAIPDLEKLIHADEETMAAAAVTALGQMPSEKVIKILLSNIDKTRGDLQLRVLNTVIQLSGKLQDTSRCKTICSTIFRKRYSATIRLAALKQVIKIDTAYGTDLLFEASFSNDSAMRRGSLALIHLVPDGPKLNEIIANSNQFKTDEIRILIHALSRKSGSNYSEFFLACAKHKNEMIRLAGLSSLKYAKTAAVVPHLISVAASSTGNERTISRESLYLINAPETDALILKMLDESEGQEKSEIIRCIGRRKINNSLEKLIVLATDQDNNIGRIAVTAIKFVADVPDVDTLVNLFLKTDDPVREKELIATLQSLVVQIDPPEQRANGILIAMADISDEGKKGQLLVVLGASGNPKVLPLLESMINKSSPNLKKEAIRSLSLWPNEDPADILLTTVKSSKSSSNKILAYRGYLELLARNENMSNQDLLSRYKEAIDIVPNQSELKKVFSDLAQVRDFAAAELTAEYLDDKNLKAEAEVALMKILWRTFKTSDKEKVKKLTQALIDDTSSDHVREEALELWEVLN